MSLSHAELKPEPRNPDQTHQLNRITLSITLCLKGKSPYLCSSCIDSGSEQTLIHPTFVQRCEIPTFKLRTPINVSALDGSEMTTITHQTEPVLFIVSGNHQEEMKFYVYSNRESPLVQEKKIITSATVFCSRTRQPSFSFFKARS